MTHPLLRAAFALVSLLPAAVAEISPAERALRALLEASASDEAAARFVEEHFDPGHFRQVPAAAIASQIRAAGRQSGGFTIERLAPRGENQIEAVLAARRVEARLLMRLGVSPAPPHRITMWGSQPMLGPYLDALFADAQGTEAQRLAALRRAIESAAAAHRFSGAVLIARGGQVLLQTAVGPAQLEPPAPNTLQTRFHLGSMPKMFTALAALQLVQAGKLQLDTPIAAYLPDYPDQEHARKITLHHLLTHTSGLGDYFGPEFDRKKSSIRKLEDYYEFFARQPLRFEPGAQLA